VASSQTTTQKISWAKGGKKLSLIKQKGQGVAMSTYPHPLTCAQTQAPLTFSASFSLLLATPEEAPFQSAKGRETPVSQIAHKSINLSQRKHKGEPQGYSRRDGGKGFVGHSLFIHWGNHIFVHMHLEFCTAE
jgi:hypothetical protein